ncbi:hypothetical protein DFJ63DRAFT_222091 [Scheffersomyces coipomensis]|uniref:uncharacterized protein n=1 Tax=Scheffersomyces coipomensis TaxID=1788519 RepID=UPI00315CF721
MTYIYNDSNIYCSSIVTHDASQIDFNQVYPLADLYYCHVCKSPKSKYQCSYEIISKYCSNCLIDYNGDGDNHHCLKNCFDCPKCKVVVGITMNNHDENGKSFSFNCKFCQFSYTTKVIEKPKSLISIITQEKKNDQDYYAKVYDHVRSSVLETQPQKSLDELKVKNLNLSTTKSKVQKSSYDIDPISDDITNQLSHHKYTHGSKSLHDTSNQWHSNEYKFPLPKPLSIKYSLICQDCHTPLLQPKVIENQPTLIKYSIKSYAKDYLPIVKLTKSHKFNHVYLLNFINPMTTKCSITISTPTTIPLRFITPKDNDRDIQITLPINKFVIGANLNKNIVKNIPTSLLTDHTSASLAELISRNKADQLTQNIAGDNGDEEEEEEVQLDFTQLVDYGSNWYTVPIHLLQITKLRNNNAKKIITVKIPLFINLKSYQNKEVYKNGNDLTPNFEIGYWNLINVIL